MQTGRLGTLVGFSLQVCGGGAAMIWPNEKWIGIWIFALGAVTAVISVIVWFKSNYRARAPWTKKGGPEPEASAQQPIQSPRPVSNSPLVHDDKFGSLTLTQSPPSLRNSVFVSDMKMTVDTVANSRASELTMTVFNGSGRVIEFGRASGRIKYKVRNGDETSSEGALPTPAADPNSALKAVQLEECYLVLRQPVPPEDANAFRLRAGTIIYFDLSELEIEVYTSEDQKTKDRLKLWDGVTVSRGSTYGRIKNATVNISMGMRASIK